MSEPPREPGPPEEPGISLPPWVDDAIARSRKAAPEESGGEAADAVSEAGPAAEMAVNPPPAETPPAEPEWQPVGPGGGLPAAEPVVVTRSPREARRRAAMPWMALALLFLGAALVVGYILLTRPRQ